MPETARVRGLADPFEPGPALKAAIEYLSDLRHRFGNLGLVLQGDAEQPVRYVEVPRKAANAEEWIASQAPALAMRASTCIHHLEVANCDKMV
jgi:hypothetical protein